MPPTAIPNQGTPFQQRHPPALLSNQPNQSHVNSAEQQHITL